jgi:transposase
LARQVIDRYHIDLKMLIFDATNFDTFIDSQTFSVLAQRGHAKSKRKDLRILGLALLVSAEHHIPLLSYAYPGNQNDAAMFSSLAETLISRCKQLAGECEDITLIFDGGNTSKENIEEVRASRYHFITSLTLTHHADLLSVPLGRFSSFEDPRLEGTQAYRTQKQLWGKECTVVITRSRRLLQGQVSGINRALAKKRATLRKLKSKLAHSQKPSETESPRERVQQRIATEAS